LNSTVGVLFIASLSIFAILNVQSFLTRTYNTGFGFYVFDRHQHELSEWINPNCKKVVHYGIGLWSGSSLWGTNFCGNVIKSEIINGAILDYEIGAKKISNSQLKELGQLVNTYASDLVIVCSLRWNENTDSSNGQKVDNLCNDIKIYLENNLNKSLKISDTISDSFQGPKIQVIETRTY
jgi:hypothetical protein